MFNNNYYVPPNMVKKKPSYLLDIDSGGLMGIIDTLSKETGLELFMCEPKCINGISSVIVKNSAMGEEIGVLAAEGYEILSCAYVGYYPGRALVKLDVSHADNGHYLRNDGFTTIQFLGIPSKGDTFQRSDSYKIADKRYGNL
jgi:hypothetical protein